MVATADNQGRERASPRSLKTIVDFAIGSHARAVMVLLVVALLGFLPGFFSIPPIDRDEARFAQATKQMIETGDYVDIRFQDESRYKKPAGIYWLQALAVKSAEAAGLPDAPVKIWLYRIPSLIVLFVVLTAATLSAVDRSARWLLAWRPLAGIAWLLLLVLPWFLAIVLKSGDSFFAESIGQDLFAKLGSVQEAHGGPPGLYLVLFWGTFFPGA